MVDEDDVLDALSNVIDPELGLDFVELGLIYGVEIEDRELVPEHFGTLGGLARLVEAKRRS
jgi:metal-sulfur cluster biosynthetic enzyme